MISLRIAPTFLYEQKYWRQGNCLVAGLDEAGRGAWAGPVAAGAVILPARASILEELPGVRDSKQMSANQREAAAILIRQVALAWGVGYASCVEIDALGIVPAIRLAMQRAAAQCNPVPQALVIDAVRLEGMIDLPQESIIRGDSLSLSIAAASILAKTSRDVWMMINAERAYPSYGFARHKGYGTAFHQQQIRRNGPCLIHRMSFRPFHE